MTEQHTTDAVETGGGEAPVSTARAARPQVLVRLAGTEERPFVQVHSKSPGSDDFRHWGWLEVDNITASELMIATKCTRLVDLTNEGVNQCESWLLEKLDEVAAVRRTRAAAHP